MDSPRYQMYLFEVDKRLSETQKQIENYWIFYA